MNFETLMDLRGQLAVKHHVPGRIRIRFKLGLLADPRAHALKNEAGHAPDHASIKRIKVNLFTRDIIIEYDPEIINPEKLHEALTTGDPARFSELAAEFKAIMDE